MSEPTRGTDPRPPIRRLRVRKAPRYEVFVGTGAVIGLIVALVSGTTGPTDPQTGRAKLVGYLAMGLVLIGGLLGGLVAIAVERFRGRSRIDDSRIDDGPIDVSSTPHTPTSSAPAPECD